MIAEGVAAARSTGGAIAAVPVKDTIKSAGPDMIVTATLDRGRLWAVQTPQVFEAELLRRAHGSVTAHVTDDAAMVEAIGGTVKLFPGADENVKVTTPGDLRLAEAALRSRGLEQDVQAP